MLHLEKVNLDLIQESKEITLKGNQDIVWLKEALVDIAPKEAITGLKTQEWADKAEIAYNITLNRLPKGDDFTVIGSINFLQQTLCHLCGVSYEDKQQIKLNDMIHIEKVKESSEEDPWLDQNYWVTSNKWFNLKDFLLQKTVLEEKSTQKCLSCAEKPIQNEEIKKNNDKAGQNGPTKGNFPFAQLKELLGK